MSDAAAHIQLSMAPPVPSRRDEILDNAARLFAEGGFANVTVDDIGASCGISGPALYHHFAGKEALLGEILVSISEHLLRGAVHVVRTEPEPSRTLAALVDWHVHFAVGRPDLITVHYRDLVHADEVHRRQVRLLQRRYVEIWVDVITKAAAGVGVRDARAAVHAVFGLINSTPFLPPLPPSRAVSSLTHLALRALDPSTLAQAFGRAPLPGGGVSADPG